MLPLPLKGAGRPYKDHAPDELHFAVLTGRCKRIKTLLKKGEFVRTLRTDITVHT